VEFDIPYSKGVNYKGKIGKISESVFVVEFGSKAFEIDKGEKRENKEVAVEIKRSCESSKVK
jgi:hypothetical protein